MIRRIIIAGVVTSICALVGAASQGCALDWTGPTADDQDADPDVPEGQEDDGGVEIDGLEVEAEGVEAEDDAGSENVEVLEGADGDGDSDDGSEGEVWTWDEVYPIELCEKSCQYFCTSTSTYPIWSFDPPTRMCSCRREGETDPFVRYVFGDSINACLLACSDPCTAYCMPLGWSGIGANPEEDGVRCLCYDGAVLMDSRVLPYTDCLTAV